MSQPIHPTAIISPDARIAAGATVGPYAVVGAAEIGAGAVIHPHVVVSDGVVVGAGTELFPGAFVGREPKGAGATARTPVFERRVVVGADCSIGPHAVIYYDVEIGAGTLVGDGASIREQCRIGSGCIISRHVSLNYDVHVADGVKVMDGTHLTGGMRVGEGAFVSSLVVTLNDNLIREGFGDHVRGPVVGAGATVGGGATLMPGVTIGPRATVAAGAVATRDVPADARVAGVPARPF